MKFLKHKGFTLIETLTALLLLGILMIGLTSAMTLLTKVTEDTEQHVTPGSDDIYLLKQLQQDALVGTAVTVREDTLVITAATGETIQYEVSNNKLYRQSRYLADVLQADFAVENEGSSFIANILLSSHKLIDVKYYLKGAT